MMDNKEKYQSSTHDKNQAIEAGSQSVVMLSHSDILYEFAIWIRKKKWEHGQSGWFKLKSDDFTSSVDLVKMFLTENPIYK